jgi:hypothetical protein
MKNYLLAILRLLGVVIRFGGARRVAVLIAVGLMSKLALLVTFVVVIKLLVFIIKIDPHGFAIDLGGMRIGVDAVIVGTCAFTSAAFFVSGWLIYTDRRSTGAFLEAFVLELRQRNLERHFRSDLPEDNRERRANLNELFGKSDPLVGRAGKALLLGVLEVLQNSIIGGLMFALLAYESLPIFLLLLVFSGLAVPVYAKLSTRRANTERSRIARITETLASKRAELLNGQALAHGEVGALRSGAAEIFFGDEATEKRRLESRGYVGTISTYPLIYGALGIAFSALLLLLVSDGLPVTADKVSSFVILAFVLRFVASNVYGVLNGVRHMNSEYAHLQKVLSLFDWECKPASAAGGQGLVP